MIRSHPEIQQTIPGVTREYRLYTNEHCDYGDFDHLERTPALVIHREYGVSYDTTYGMGGVNLNVYSRYDWGTGEQLTPERHPLHGMHFATKEQAEEAAFDAGLVAYMVYEDVL